MPCVVVDAAALGILLPGYAVRKSQFQKLRGKLRCGVRSGYRANCSAFKLGKGLNERCVFDNKNYRIGVIGGREVKQLFTFVAYRVASDQTIDFSRREHFFARLGRYGYKRTVSITETVCQLVGEVDFESVALAVVGIAFAKPNDIRADAYTQLALARHAGIAV